MPGTDWFQLDVDLRGRGDDAPNAVLAEVFGAIGSRHDGPGPRMFFFMRKTPGLRLRFRGDADAADAAAAIMATLEALRRRRAIRHWVRVPYEPEIYKFGGPRAMAAVHAHFDADSRAWWRWQRLRQAGRADLDPRLLSTAVLNDLFTHCLEGPEEVWDVWCRVGALLGREPTIGIQRGSAPGIEVLLEQVGSGERALLIAYRSANAALAARLARLQARGRLLVGRRMLLPHIALYHWNRYGLTLEWRASMVEAMLPAWSPFPRTGLDKV